MTIPRWLKRVLPVVAVVIAGGVYVFTEYFSLASVPPIAPPMAPIVLTSEDPEGHGSENVRIVDDSTDADIGQDLSPSDASAAMGDEYSPNNRVETNATVIKVIDGDTLEVRFDIGDTARVRMLGVNTPETVDPRKPVECFGKEASAFTKSKLEGKLVRLDADPQADERDMYGRLLRNVVLDDGTDFNALLVSEGYAHAYVSFPLDPVRKKQLTDLEAAANAAKKGLWGDVCR